MNYPETLFFCALSVGTVIAAGIACAFFVTRMIRLLNGATTARKKLRGFSSDVIDQPDDIRDLLEEALQQKRQFQIRLNGMGSTFNSSLLEIERSHLLIDTLFPDEGMELIRDSRFISVDFLIHSRRMTPYRFDAVYLDEENHNGYPALKISMPKTVNKDQKRKYHRVEPPVSNPLFIQFYLENEQFVERVCNISGGGAGFFTNLGKNHLWSGKRLENVSISVPGITTIDCIVVVHTVSQAKNPVLIEGKPYHYYCGAEFLSLDDSTRKKIIRYVLEKEREQLKRLNREFA